MNKWINEQTNKQTTYVKLWTYRGLRKVHCFKDEAHLRGHLNDFSTHKAKLKAIIFKCLCKKFSNFADKNLFY